MKIASYSHRGMANEVVHLQLDGSDAAHIQLALWGCDRDRDASATLVIREVDARTYRAARPAAHYEMAWEAECWDPSPDLRAELIAEGRALGAL